MWIDDFFSDGVGTHIGEGANAYFHGANVKGVDSFGM
jgi:hypothetical protein